MNNDLLNQLAATAYAARESIATAADVLPPQREDQRQAETLVRDLIHGKPQAARVAVAVLQALVAIGQANAEAQA